MHGASVRWREGLHTATHKVGEFPHGESSQEPSLSRNGRFCLSELANYCSIKLTIPQWVEWHSFLTAMRFPTYKVEEADMKSIYEVAGLGHLYSEGESDAASRSNYRTHREKFTWQGI